MSRNRLQGHNEAEAWRVLTDLEPTAEIRATWVHEPITHWSIQVSSPLRGLSVIGRGVTRYEALHRVLIELEKERQIEDEINARASS